MINTATDRTSTLLKAGTVTGITTLVFPLAEARMGSRVTRAAVAATVVGCICPSFVAMMVLCTVRSARGLPLRKMRRTQAFTSILLLAVILKRVTKLIYMVMSRPTARTRNRLCTPIFVSEKPTN